MTGFPARRNGIKANRAACGPGSQTRAKALVIIGKSLAGYGIGCLVAALPAMSSQVSTSEFLAHCEAAPEPCREKVLAYVKFLADGGFLNKCSTRLPAAEVGS